MTQNDDSMVKVEGNQPTCYDCEDEMIFNGNELTNPKSGLMMITISFVEQLFKTLIKTGLVRTEEIDNNHKLYKHHQH